MKMEPVVWLTAIRGKLSRRYALPGSGSGTGTIDAIPCSTSNVWPQSRDRVNRIWSLWKSSQATYTSPPGPTATVAPWFCEFGEWLSERIGVQLRPPSEERWSTIFVPWLPSKKAHGMYTFPSQVPPVSSTTIHSLSVTREFPGPREADSLPANAAGSPGLGSVRPERGDRHLVLRTRLRIDRHEDIRVLDVGQALTGLRGERRQRE